MKAMIEAFLTKTFGPQIEALLTSMFGPMLDKVILTALQALVADAKSATLSPTLQPFADVFLMLEPVIEKKLADATTAAASVTAT